VIARSRILAVWAALKQLSENENDAMCVVLLRILKTKNFNMLLSFLSTLPPHLIELSKVFQAVCFNFALTKAYIELCINKLSDAAGKSELKANCEKFDSELGELRTPDGLADSCVSSVMAICKGTERLVNRSSPYTKWETVVNEPITGESL